MTDKYFEQQSVLRAKQAWNNELKTEKLIEKEYLLLSEEVKQEVAELYARYGTEGLVDYNKLRVKLTQAELNMYENKIQSIISQNREIEDEEILVELDKLKNYNSITVLDSKVNTIEALTLITVYKSIELVSQGLLETQESIKSYTNYDIQRKTGFATPVKKKTQQELMKFILEDDEFTGLTFTESIKSSRHRLVRDIRRSIATGVKRKESFQRLSKGLDKQVLGGKGGKSILNTLRGETTRVISETALETYEEAGLDKYQFVATLDNRTTDVCSSLDGTIHNVVDAQEGVNMPKMHYGCRSTIAPYIPEDDLSERKRRARNPVSQQNYKIPADISYKEWNKKYN